MIYNYIKNKYGIGEPIFLSEIPNKSNAYLRQDVKKLVDSGRLVRVYNGVYYLPYKTMLGTDGKMSIKKYIEKKYLKRGREIIGYYSGLYLANLYGLTTQNPSCYEVCSNEATTKQRKLNIDGINIIVYKPVLDITNENVKILRFLDLILNIDRYNELQTDDLRNQIKSIIQEENIDIDRIEKYLPHYPTKIFKNLYYGGVISELV